MGFSTDMVHGGHITILKRAARLGRVVVGILSDNAMASYKRFPIVPYEQRKILIENLKDVYKVIEQKELSYKENLLAIRPAYVVHGDDWREGVQKTIRDEVIQVLNAWGGELVEFPYSKDEKLAKIEHKMAS